MESSSVQGLEPPQERDAAAIRAARLAALTAACSASDENAHVLRACATALGAIGKPAASALPVLRELVKLPRVEWAANAAIRRIESAVR